MTPKPGDVVILANNHYQHARAVILATPTDNTTFHKVALLDAAICRPGPSGMDRFAGQVEQVPLSLMQPFVTPGPEHCLMDTLAVSGGCWHYDTPRPEPPRRRFYVQESFDYGIGEATTYEVCSLKPGSNQATISASRLPDRDLAEIIAQAMENTQ